MWFKIKKDKMYKIDDKLNKIYDMLNKSNIREWSYILGNKKEIVIRNLMAGIFRGVGIGIGITVITAVLVLLLRRIVSLNIPVIGEYIADIVEIVERSR